jgi:hypothetical protein
MEQSISKNLQPEVLECVALNCTQEVVPLQDLMKQYAVKETSETEAQQVTGQVQTTQKERGSGHRQGLRNPEREPVSSVPCTRQAARAAIFLHARHLALVAWRAVLLFGVDVRTAGIATGDAKN